MKQSIAALFLLLTFASHGTWCAAAGRSTKVDAAAHHLRPHLQVQGFHGKMKHLEIQSPRKLGHGTMGAGMGGPGGGVGAGGRSGGGAANERPHNNKNGAAVASPAPVTSILALVLTCSVVFSAFRQSF